MFSYYNLPTGLRVITVPMRGTKTATILVMVGTGSKYEIKEEGGISHFLEHLFFKGTKKRPNTMEISIELDSVGAEFNAFTAKEYTGYYVKVDAGKIELAFDVVSDMLLDSLFDPAEIEREKGVIIEELNMYQDNPMFFVEDLFEECLYGDTPAGRDVIGTKKSIASISREKIIAYLASQYGAQNTIICVAGNIEKERIESLAQKYFGRYIATSSRSKEKVIESQEAPAVKTLNKKTDQAHLAIGVRTFPSSDPDEHIARFLAIMLGGSMSSRLFLNLRERRGLAYYVRTTPEFFTDSGYLVTQAGVPTDKLEESIKVILSEYRKLVERPAGEREIKKIKDLVRGRLIIQLESSDNMAQWFARRAITSIQAGQPVRRIEKPEEYLKKLDTISASDLKRVAQRIFADRGLNLAVIGPFDNGDRFTGKLSFKQTD